MDEKAQANKEISATDVRTFFQMAASEFMRDWKLLSEADKAWFKEKVAEAQS